MIRLTTLANLVGLLALCLFSATTANAQYENIPKFKRGDIELSVGVGLSSGWFQRNQFVLDRPIALRVDYLLKNHISLGLYAGRTRTMSRTMIGNQGEELYQYKTTSHHLGLRLTSRIQKGRWLYYGGAHVGVRANQMTRMRGVNMWKPYEISGTPKHTSGTLRELKPHLAGFIGTSFHYRPKQSIFAELSSDVSSLTLGWRIKL